MKFRINMKSILKASLAFGFAIAIGTALVPPTEAQAEASAMASLEGNRLKQFVPDGFVCWNIGCNPAQRICCS